MTATRIDGRAYAADLKRALAAEVAALRGRGVRPGLATVLVGDSYPARAYERRVARLAAELGVRYAGERLPPEAEEAEAVATVGKLDADPRVSGILVLRPLPPQVSEVALYNALDPLKDIEAVHPVNAGLLALGRPRYVPSTPASVFHVLDRYLRESGRDPGDFYARSNVVMVGRSNNVGKPAMLFGMARNATVLSCDVHSFKAGLLYEHTARADILIVAAGVPGLLTGEHVKDGAIAVDVGINLVGAGPSGLAQLHAFEEARARGAEVPDLVCFEKQRDWGGLWNYTWRTGLDEHGMPVHGSMYRYLWSNGPKECLEFADHTFDEHFGRPIPSFPPREVLYDYITGRARKNDVRRFIEFGTAVRWISYDGSKERFEVTVETLDDGRARTEEFDHVIVATGHFSTPNVPAYEGFEGFPGRVLHSHDFRDAREFTGKDLLVLGSSYSAEDIALQSRKYGANSVTISYRNKPMGFGWPAGITEVPALLRMSGGTAHFADGTARDVDAIVLCTGYLHALHFVADDLRLRTGNVLYTPSLYKGVFWLDNPKMMYLGMQDQYYTFTFFDAQAWYARDYVLGRVKLPPRDAMAADIEAWRARQDTLADPAEEIDFQADHMAELLAETDYPAFDIDLTRAHFKTWEYHKEESVTGYRDRGFSSPCTGTPAPVHHTPWWDEADDSMATFLDGK